MLALYLVLVLIISGQIIRVVPPSFSIEFFLAEAFGVALVAYFVSFAAKWVLSTKHSRAIQKASKWFGGAVYLLCLAFYFWHFDWPTNTSGVEPLNNSGLGFSYSLVMSALGLALAVLGFRAAHKQSSKQ